VRQAAALHQLSLGLFLKGPHLLASIDIPELNDLLRPKMPHGSRFYENTLPTPEITRESLQETLVDLQTAVHDGVQLIESKHPAGDDNGRGIFTGDLGTSVAP
jgi:hypothetical protein